MAGIDEVRVARATLAGLVQVGDPYLVEVVATHGPVEALARLAARDLPSGVLRALPGGATGGPLRERAAAVARQAAGVGARVVIPQDDEWPAHLPDLAATPAPGGVLCLWVRTETPRTLSDVLGRAVAVVGARAATPYGTHVAEQVGYDLAGAGWTVVSTGAYGVDGAAARGALTGGGAVVAVLPAGVDRPYPSGHAGLFDQITARGLLVSPWPPGTTPTRTQFAVTSRLVATLAAGTVLVEATTRSTSLRALDQSLTLGRPGMVVPGPVTSAMSAGPHQALRTHRQARLVRGAADVIAELVPPADNTE